MQVQVEDHCSPPDATPREAWLINAGGAQIGLRSEILTCGRAPGNTLVLDDVSVSQHHVRFERRPKGYVMVSLDSANGTYVGGEELPTGAGRLLRDGDRLMIGAFAFTFRLGLRRTAATPPPPPPAAGQGRDPDAVRFLATVPEITRAGDLIYARVGARGVLNGRTIGSLLQTCRWAIDRNVAQIMINVAHLDYVDGAGLRRLAALGRELEGRGGGVTLVAPGPNVRRTVDRLDLATALPMHADESRALAAVGTCAPEPLHSKTNGWSRWLANGATARLVLPTGQIWPLADDLLTIGRRAGSQMLIDDPRVSPEHAAIVRAGGQYLLLNCGTRNGTFVNGWRLRDLHLLRDGDRLEVANRLFHFQAFPSGRGSTEPAAPTPTNGSFTSVGAVDLGVLLFDESPPAGETAPAVGGPANLLAGRPPKIVRAGGEYFLVDLRSSNAPLDQRRIHDLQRLRDRALVATGTRRFTFVRRTTPLEDVGPPGSAPGTSADGTARPWARLRPLAGLLPAIRRRVEPPA